MIRLQNATYLVDDHEAAIGFFVDGLGFTLRQDETFAGGWRRVVVGPTGQGAGFVLALVEPDDERLGRQVGADIAFFLETDDFEGQHAQMTARGIRFREEPRREPYGTVAILEDLYGAPWDLIQPPH